MNDCLWSVLSPPGSSRVGPIVVSPLVSFGLLSQKPSMTQLELCEAKNGTAAFFKKDTSLSHWIWLSSLPPGNGGEGGQLWWDDLV